MTKAPEELVLMAESSRLLASVFALLDRTPLAGMPTLEVDTMVERYIADALQPRPARKGSTATASCSIPRSTTWSATASRMQQACCATATGVRC